MYDDLYGRPTVFSRDFRRDRVYRRAAQVSFRVNLEKDGLIHRESFVGNYVKATLFR